MATVDSLARAGAVSLLVLVALSAVRERPRTFVSWMTLVLGVAAACHLVISSPDYIPTVPLDLFFRGAALAAPAVFWVFTRAFFGDDDRPTAQHAGAMVALAAVGFGRPAPWAQALYYGGSLAVVCLALVQVLRELRHDLIESRRNMRTVFAAMVGIEILIVLGLEWWLGGAMASRDVEALRSLGALVLAFGFAAWLLAPRRDVLAVPAKRTLSSTADSTAEPDVDARYRERLLAAVHGEQLYRREGMTIRTLALELELPEYRVRRIINQQLGYRNFNAFLNDLRTAEACRLLADPAHERLPILNLALELGYGSLGPFNRAFRARTGQTPTDYRRAHLDSPTPGHESPAES